MANFAHVTLIGHVGRAPEIRFTPSGEQVASFSIATNHKRRDQDDLTTWWSCSVWGKRAAVIQQYVNKGDPLMVTGAVCQRPYTDKEGYAAVSLDVNVSDFTLLGGSWAAQGASGAPDGSTPKRRTATPQSGAQAAQVADDFDPDADIPF